jgi:hypothetical protein
VHNSYLQDFYYIYIVYYFYYCIKSFFRNCLIFLNLHNFNIFLYILCNIFDNLIIHLGVFMLNNGKFENVYDTKSAFDFVSNIRYYKLLT